MVEAMKPGSVIVDLAAEAGGNCEVTSPGKLAKHAGVTIIGYTDLPSRLPTQSSTLYSNNVTNFLLSIAPKKEHYGIDMADEVVRGAIVTHNGDKVPRPAPPAPATTPTTGSSTVSPNAAAPTPASVAAKDAADIKALTPWQLKTREVALISAGMGTALVLGKLTDPAFMGSLFTFSLAGLIGYRIVWSVAPALHSPLMSVTNAISGLVGVGGFFIMGGGYLPQTFPQVLGAASVLLAFVNISGGFVISKRMLDMFKRPTDPPEYPWLYAVPAVLSGAGFIAAASTGLAGLVPAGYLVSSVLCIASLTALASQATARAGNYLGILGVLMGILASLAACGFTPEQLAQALIFAGLGSGIGAAIGRRITATELPQFVAALHSVVGLAAVLTSIGSVAAAIWGGLDEAHITMLHLVTGYLGVLVGGITFTGSIVAFLKLSGKMSSRPLNLPGKHYVNGGMLALNAASMAAFITMPTVPFVAAGCLAANTLLSFAKGFTTTAAIGGGDMPVCITVLNAYSGLALVAEGLMLNNPLLTSVGALIAASGSILSHIMCVGMNRSLPNVLFGGIAPAAQTDYKVEGEMVETNAADVAESMMNSQSIIIVVGYGMVRGEALSQAVSLLNFSCHNCQSGCRQSSVSAGRDDCSLACNGGQSPLRYSSSCWTYARTM